MQNEVCCRKQEYMDAVSQLVLESILSSGPVQGDVKVTLLPAKRKQSEMFVDFLIPKSVTERLVTAFANCSNAEEFNRLCDCLCQVKDATIEWKVPINDVNICKGNAHFHIKADFLAKFLCSEILSSCDRDTFVANGEITLICCLPASNSIIRTFCLYSSYKTIVKTNSHGGGKYLSSSKSAEVILSQKLLKTFGLKSEEFCNCKSSNQGILSRLKEKNLLQTDGNVPVIAFDCDTLNTVKCTSCQALCKTVVNTKLKVNDCALNCLTEMYSYVSATAESQLLFLGCQSDYTYIQQLKATLVLVWSLCKQKNPAIAEKSCICFLLKNCDLLHGPVTLSEKSFTPDQLLAGYCDEIKSSFEAKYGLDTSWMPMVDTIADSVLKLDLFSVTRQSNLHLDANSSHNDSIFILYNYSRLASILYKFDEGVKAGTYPSLPDMECVDFSLLREAEERQLVDHLWEFGSRPLIYSCVNLFKPHLLIVFLKKLCKTLSCYYSRHHILGQNLTHLYPTMFARLYLIKSVQRTMRRIFEVLNVTPVDQM